MRDTGGTGTPAVARFLQKFPQLQWLFHIILTRCMRMSRKVFYLRPPSQQVGLHATAKGCQGRYLQDSRHVAVSVRNQKICKTDL